MNRLLTWKTRIHSTNFHQLAGLILLLTMGACSVLLEAALPHPTPSTDGLLQLFQYNTLEQAQEHTSFPLLAPQTGQLPQGLALASVEYWTQEQDPGEVILANYSAEGADLTITETLTLQRIAPPPDLPYRNIRIRGRDGYFIAVEGQPAAYAIIWEENWVMLTISSSGLAKEELCQIANDLEPLR